MGLIILFGLVTIAGVLYYLYDMHNQKKIERGYWSTGLQGAGDWSFWEINGPISSNQSAAKS